MTRVRSSSLFGVLVALVLGLSGCGKDKPKADEQKKSEAVPVPSDMVFNDFLPTTGSAAGLGVRDSGLEGGLADLAAGGGDGAEPDGAKLAVKVIEPGAEPRAARKYAFVANKVDKRIFTISQSVTQSAGGQTTPAQELTLKIHMDLTTKSVKPAGATIEAKVTKVELPGGPPQASQMLASLNGLSGSFDVSPRGEVGEISFAAGPQMKNQLAESILGGLSQGLQLLLTPLPDVPVGVGAKWELVGGKQEGETNGRRFTLKEVSNEGGVVDTDIDMKVPRRAEQGPRGGMMFVETDGKGKFTQQIRWSSLSPRSEGELTVIEKIEISDPKGGAKQTITQTQHAKQLIETPGK